MTMTQASAVVRRVLDEEIERHGTWWATENCWCVVKGKGEDRQPIDELTPAVEATAARTGLSPERVLQMFRPSRPLIQQGVYLSTSHKHRERRLAEGRLRLIDHAAEPERNIFHYAEPVECA